MTKCSVKYLSELSALCPANSLSYHCLYLVSNLSHHLILIPSVYLYPSLPFSPCRIILFLSVSNSSSLSSSSVSLVPCLAFPAIFIIIIVVNKQPFHLHLDSYSILTHLTEKWTQQRGALDVCWHETGILSSWGWSKEV